MDDVREPASRAAVLGRSVPARLLAPLQASPAPSQAALARDGYLFLPGLLPAAAVLEARRAILGRLPAVDEVADPVEDAIATGRSRRRALHADLGRFWRSISEEPSLRRCAGRGKATGVHCDTPFFTRLTKRVVTCWCALGPVPLEEGPLFLLEGSHRAADLAARVEGFDVARDKDRKATLAEDAITLAEQRGIRLLSADFAVGDVLVFGMLTYHGAFDNISPRGRVRLSCDVRLQPAGEPLDPRYFGPEPLGTTGVGYGELNGAKPINEDWHVR